MRGTFAEVVAQFERGEYDTKPVQRIKLWEGWPDNALLLKRMQERWPHCRIEADYVAGAPDISEGRRKALEEAAQLAWQYDIPCDGVIDATFFIECAEDRRLTLAEWFALGEEE